jgi:hypothetical protein
MEENKNIFPITVWDSSNNQANCDELIYTWNDYEESKNAIELSSKAELEPTLQSIKKAVDEGEFDKLLEEQLAYGSRLTKVN